MRFVVVAMVLALGGCNDEAPPDGAKSIYWSPEKSIFLETATGCTLVIEKPSGAVHKNCPVQ